MNDLLKCVELADQIRKSINTSEKAAALIKKWSNKNLGPFPLESAIALEARNQVFGWGR